MMMDDDATLLMMDDDGTLPLNTMRVNDDG
jgi:hypothetical protein